VRKSETLRGRGAFDALFAAGLRANAPLIRCLYAFDDTPSGCLHVGFSVPYRSGIAVRRNRLRRLMREAFRREENTLQSALNGAGRSASLLFVYRGSRERARGPLHLDTVHRDVLQLCRFIIASAARIPE
jgi:ribonuclease P protein component